MDGKQDYVLNRDNKVSRLFLRTYRKVCSGSRAWRIVYKCLGVVLNSDFGRGGGGNIQSPLRLPHPFNIIISEHARIGAGCTIFHGVTVGSNEKEPIEESAPIIGKNVYVGAGAILIGSIHVGDGARIGAGAVVTRDVPPGATVVGFNRVIISEGEELLSE